MASTSSTSIVLATEAFVQKEMAGLDGSHDFHHIQRVRSLAKTIATMEGNVDMELVELGALLHDIDDWKYSGSETAGLEKARSWLESQNFAAHRVESVLEIINGVGFKTELGNRNKPLPAEAAVVQDADRLDAIGAIGIARAFTYGGKKNRPLYDPSSPLTLALLSKEEYMARSSNQGATLQHFFEKLLHLKDLMKTPSGHKLAEERHNYMVTFVSQFLAEWAGER